ncbi:hypothetical protein V500_01006 [Pseudogymnoascus sp. VKM F-4518 (FW-2643)]|nr:hypothetical protein V500_01006 [Pseudogymnoascus sp. VKM F-4518 (FW-2643)]
MTKNVVERSFHTASSIIYAQLNDPVLQNNLQAALKDESEEVRLRYFCSLPDNRHYYYIFSDSFKSISFEFITHRRRRYSEAEEVIRINLQKMIRITTGLLVFNWYRFVLQSAPDRAAIQKNGAGRLRVKANLEMTFCWGPLSKIPKDICTLPAATGFGDQRSTIAVPEVDHSQDPTAKN